MGFFDRFKRKHEIAPSALPKAARVDAARESEVKPAATTMTRKEGTGSVAKDDLGVLVRPVVSEKATRLAAQGQYVFMVAPGASKGAVAHAFAHRYGIKPAGVQVQRYAGSSVRFGRRHGTTKSFKKAIVVLPHGRRVDVLQHSPQA